MRNIIIAAALAVIGLTLAGCQSTAYSARDRAIRNSRIRSLNTRMFVTDVDSMLHLDKPSHLSPWLVRDYAR